METDVAFPCTRCGHCCRHVDRHAFYRHLDRGDGGCRHLIDATHLCAIYEDRPLECRLDRLYERDHAHLMTRADYYAENLAACANLAAEHA